MVKAGVIEKVTEPTDWVSLLAIVQKKNGALRVCLDAQNLNRAIKRPQYNLPTFEDITSKLAGAKYFSLLDAVSAFWQISLDEESSRLCTFSSPFRRFKFLRMPYGIKCAPERFQRVVAEMLEDIQNADNFFDDLIVWGKTLEEHNEALEKVFKRYIEFNLKLSKEKSKICQTRDTFLGHTLSSDGIAVDKSKL
ncbi:Retrovirus-related Pol polyprotein from transposon 17.6 [Araneus ventricosus]|uniref:Retrovirus-related Pol polyprotein from transposon 17.6 n=1 Tax=Araneus ventricosus TaxID=182803 RepID=A0A4Y2K612_ARAVE|nr:Retrovirus-related Pol polyprotein from transposon 17.6 [Araneus ventricosus]